MSSHYRLENKKAIPCSMLEWAEQYEELSKQGKKHVGENFIDGIKISTIWLGLNHAYDSSDSPKIFETMVFDNKGQDIYCKRYSTWEEAKKGHKEAIKLVKNKSI